MAITDSRGRVSNTVTATLARPGKVRRPASTTLPPAIPLAASGAVEVQHDVHIVGHGGDEQMFGAE
jgi:hypothetical protein